MDRIDTEGEAITKERRQTHGLLGKIIDAARGAIAKRKDGKESPIYDIAIFFITLLVARCHIVFGAYPIALAVIAILPSRVWISVIGSVVGSLTLGKAGIIYAMISVIVAFLRLIISGTDKETGDDGREKEVTLFHENILLRVSAAVIGGFIAAVYEVLLNSFTMTSILFGGAMVVLPAAISFALSGIFTSGISPSAVFRGTSEIFSLKRKDEKDRMRIIFFECSALLGIFLISLSLEQYELLGVSAGYIFAAITTIFTARRFGAIKGAAVGFVSSVGLSGIYSVAFALAGLAAGALSSFGVLWSVIFGGAALCAWGAYTDGLIGFLALFPEYAIASSVAIPLFKSTRLERTEEELSTAQSQAEDMVGTMALSYKSKFTGALDSLEDSFGALAGVLRRIRGEEDDVSEAEAERLISECVQRYFTADNPHIPGAEEARASFLKEAPRVSTILAKNKRISPRDFNTPPHLSVMANSLADSINRAMAILSEEKFKERMRDTSPEDFEYVAKLINEARLRDGREKALNEALTERVKEAISALGISGFAAQVFGERAPHIIIATEDETGTIITSPEIIKSLEEITGTKIATPEYYRRGRMALLECHAARSHSALSYATGDVADGSNISGDSSNAFETEEGRHFSIISDGMGSGIAARRSADFVIEFLGSALGFGAGCECALRLLNNMIKRKTEGTTVTVDLFSLDLISGEAMFYKCGAAPSYIKRGSSLFRIRSRTSPLGPLGELDAERVRVEVEGGDYIVMFSDGISQDGEDAPWLIELLAKPLSKEASPEALASQILKTAKEKGASADDMTVRVIKIMQK